MSQLKQISSNKCFGGIQKVFSHHSKELSCDMNFSVFLPAETENQKYPVLYYLSGLTCNELNCVQKGGFQRYAAEHGLIVVCPDTSPRNIEGLDESGFAWDFGYGAGFYVDATTEQYKKNFRMYSYITSELIDVINSNFAGELRPFKPTDIFANFFNFSEPKQAINYWSFDGRSRCFDLRLEKSWPVPERFRVLSYFEPYRLSVGQESIGWIPRP